MARLAVRLAALHQIGAVPLSEVVGKLKTVKLDGNLIRTARALGISPGD